MSIPPISPPPAPPLPPPPSGNTNNVDLSLKDILTSEQYASLFSTNNLTFLTPSDVTLREFFAELSSLRKQLQEQLKANEIIDGSARDSIIQGMIDSATSASELYEVMHKEMRTIQNIVKVIIQSINEMNDSINNLNHSAAKNNHSFNSSMQSSINSFNLIANATNATLASSSSTAAQKATAVNNYNAAVSTLNLAINSFNNQVADSNDARAAYMSALNNYLDIAAFNNTVIDKFNARSPVVKLGYQPTNIPQFNTASGSLTGLNPASGTPPSVPLFTQNPSNFLQVYTIPVAAIEVPLSVGFLNAVAVFLSIFLPFTLPLLNLILFGSTTLDSINTLTDKKWNDPNVQKYSVVPDSYVKAYANHPVSSNSQASGSITTAVSVTGLGSGQIANVLNKALISDIVEKADPEASENALQELIKLLLLLIAGLMNASAAGAIPGALGTLTPALATLAPPPNSPSITIVTSLSVLNRNIETASSSSLKKLIGDFVDKNPSFVNLTETEKSDLATQLTGAFSLTLLLAGAKTLSESLGLPQLLTQLLGSIPSISPSIAEILSAQGQSTQKALEDQKIQSDIEQSFLDRGFSAEAAKLLGSVGLATLQNLFLKPTATTITPETVNTDLTRDSLAAQLLLNEDLKLNTSAAQSLADNIVKQAILEADSTKVSRVRDEITNILILRGINSREAQIIASNVLFIPREEILLQQLPPQLPPTDVEILKETPLQQLSPQLPATGVTKPSESGSLPIQAAERNTPTTFKQLSTEQLIAILEKRSLELLVPELGLKLATTVTQNITEALLGSNQATEKNLENPNSFIRLVSDNIQDIKLTKAEDRQKVVTEAFREYIQPSVDLNPFLLKLLDPAYGPIAMVAIMYMQTKTQFSVGQGRSSGVDIPI